ncbi:MAG: precorrin-2 C(20)-methyltransferase [Oscillospiraceae bacterium]|nr:precorrin-2 C(20)-methyltransferase [Oscillospiraceae bacterium]
MEKKGVLYCVGVGPGDPELLTLKAVRTIERCSVLAAPRTESGAMLALDIVRGAAGIENKTVLPLDFSMSRSEEKRRRDYDAAAAAIEKRLEKGEDVALLNIGDVSVYATCGLVGERLRARGYETVMIPGVTSFCAAAAALGESLTERDEPLHIVPAGAFGTEEALKLPGTKVLMKAGRSLPRVLAAIREHGCLESAALVADCGLPGEKVCRDLTRPPEDPGYFVTVIVKKS